MPSSYAELRWDLRTYFWNPEKAFDILYSNDTAEIGQALKLEEQGTTRIAINSDEDIQAAKEAKVRLQAARDLTDEARKASAQIEKRTI